MPPRVAAGAYLSNSGQCASVRRCTPPVLRSVVTQDDGCDCMNGQLATYRLLGFSSYIQLYSRNKLHSSATSTFFIRNPIIPFPKIRFIWTRATTHELRPPRSELQLGQVFTAQRGGPDRGPYSTHPTARTGKRTYEPNPGNTNLVTRLILWLCTVNCSVARRCP